MNSEPSTSKHNAAIFDDDELFEDSTILANFNNSSFKDTSARVNESNLNDSNATLNVSALCCDEEISGYDKLTGKTWIYPTNYPVRDYQFNIIRAALVKNTLVSLPTGLGKTFIAAVIMYNFYRWYPLGKIIFTAPTRPLVAQQIDACYNIVAIPPDDTVEMTGHMQQTTRKAHWQSKRVFFATPQVIYNDIKSGVCPANSIRCLVIDEAHRARGNYAYCQIVGTLTDMGQKTYRILALSATPGSKVEDVVNVVKNLHIAHLELRNENCIDVAPYSHARKINTVIVHLGPELTQLRQNYVEILDGYARRLKQFNILPQNLGNLSKGRIVMLYKEYQTKERGARHPQHSYIMKDFSLLIALYHGLELLVKHGSRVFLNFFDEHPEKSWMQADDRLTMLLERLRDDLGINPLALDRSVLPDGTVPEIPKNIYFGHPKFYKLKEIMMEHFSRAKEKKQDTRAIVFCEYRESVSLVHCLLLQCRPLIQPEMFVGQGASGKDGKTVISQKQQLRVMRSFREGQCNALVATCVAEEGLDVGSVDLILCFDISTRSPIRLVQRCGRTGRERGGQVFILVTEGREHQTLLDCMRQRDGLTRKIQDSRDVTNSLYANNPRMMPLDLMPKCQKMFITVAKKADDRRGDKSKKGQNDLRKMLVRVSSSSSASSKEFDSGLISEEDFKRIYPDGYREVQLFEDPKEIWCKSKESIKSSINTESSSKLKLTTWLEWQRNLQKTVNIEHSKDTEILASLLQYSDAKRFDLPASTQNPCFNSQEIPSQKIISLSPLALIASPAKSTPTKRLNSPAKLKQTKKKVTKFPLFKSPGKKDGDIRALFSTATKSTKNYTKLISELGAQSATIPTRLLNLLVDLSIENSNKKQCYICNNLCECTVLSKMRKNDKKVFLTVIKQPMLPDIDLIDDIDNESIANCAKNIDNSINISIEKAETMKEEKANQSNNFDLGFMFDDELESDKVHDKEIKDCDKINEIIHPVKCENLSGNNDVQPKSNEMNNSKNFELEYDFDSPFDLATPENQDKVYENFDIGDIDQMFSENDPNALKNNDEKNSRISKEDLGFQSSIGDIFADSDDDFEVKPETPKKQILISDSPVKNEKNPELPKMVTVSPSILSGRAKANVSTSPILGSQVTKRNLSIKKKPQTSTPHNNAKRCLIPEIINNNSIMISPNESKNVTSKSIADLTNKSMLTITQTMEMINRTDNRSALSTSNTKTAENQIVDRFTSPILLTQADRTKIAEDLKSLNTTPVSDIFFNFNGTIPKSLIILSSDDDSDSNTQEYDAEDVLSEKSATDVGVTEKSPIFETQRKSQPDTPIENTAKRKFPTDNDNPFDSSPYFNKKPKLDNDTNKLSLQKRILSQLASNKITKSHNNDNTVNFVLSPIKFSPQKENKTPVFPNGKFEDDEREHSKASKLKALQMFRKDSKIQSPKELFDSLINSPFKPVSKRKITFDDSDDDFDDKPSKKLNNRSDKHKIRREKRKPKSEFLDLEAEQSDDGSHSGDELTDDSAGSIAEFICDENVTYKEDMEAHYLRSIKSPVHGGGVFKIPQLPKAYKNEDILSQYVEEDEYEMDSFCVDSHIGLTQVHDVSELEVAEKVLESSRGSRKRHRPAITSPENDKSPLIRRINKKVRQIHSDSEDST